MWVLSVLGIIGLVLGFAFMTLAIASGLYYLSEVLEEHTVLAKKFLTRLIFTVIAIQVLLCAVDGFPLTLTAIGIGSHVVYYLNLQRFPVVKLTSPVFILSCVLVLVNHYLCFRHFSSPPSPVLGYGSSYSSYDAYNLPSFTEIASYFGICVWLVPFSLFVGLSAGENVLPTMGSEYATGSGSSFAKPGAEPGASGYGRMRSGTNTGMAKAAVSGVKEWIAGTGELMGFWRGDRIRPHAF
ncbi:DUF396-domain-containing protein [Eremomyces bilateralis CBS 781.70]|uniref:DUF396-domain-containing protein n=1 Tax=Eremomyces bilateralis CBS 781.70 TaxID=1392243 RepID=A0A6G1GBL7_9PEZI|nr:DUF396-domain-containing protein [Eremomyces bilateralis CBS 781.70]KAF1815475.1 DUF396-domain-containing protein [Eremomyces bilateralis CBS 781.70]